MLTRRAQGLLEETPHVGSKDRQLYLKVSRLLTSLMIAYDNKDNDGLEDLNKAARAYLRRIGRPGEGFITKYFDQELPRPFVATTLRERFVHDLKTYDQNHPFSPATLGQALCRTFFLVLERFPSPLDEEIEKAGVTRTQNRFEPDNPEHSRKVSAAFDLVLSNTHPEKWPTNEMAERLVVRGLKALGVKVAKGLFKFEEQRQGRRKQHRQPPPSKDDK